MDSVSNNVTMMTHLTILLESGGINFDPCDCQVACYTHCIDLAFKVAIGPLPNKDMLQDNDEATLQHPITLACMVVQTIQGSNLHQEEFNEVITQGNLKQQFKSVDGEVITVKPLQLLRNVRTRWDLCYCMLERLQVLCPVCAVLSYFLSNTDLHSTGS
jgi:hypothetical protein